MLAVVLVSACDIDRPMSTEVRAIAPTVARSTLEADTERKDTPWQRMSDSAFALAVARGNNRVIIGLKEPGMAEGVDNSGRALTNLQRVRTGLDALVASGVEVVREFRNAPAVVATVNPALAAELRRNAWVDYVEPDSRIPVASQTTPWGVAKIKATDAWSLATGSGVKVLILDTGVTHSDIAVSVAFRCVDGTLSSDDDDGHGTHVAGTIAALNNSAAVVGVASGVTLWSGDVSSSSTYPNTGSLSVAEIACAIDFARDNGVSVVNMSFGDTNAHTSITDQINGGFNNEDMIFVAGAGNDYSGAVRFPASLGNVIAVTAVDSTNAKAAFANVGSQIDLAAPGVDILSTALTSGYRCYGGSTALCSGTSMATAHVSGAAALLRSRYPGWSNTTVRDRLYATATDLGSGGFDNTFGNGLVNVDKAVRMTAGLGGTTFAYTGYAETWSSSPSGGQSPYSYQWYINGSAAGTSSSLNYTPGGSNFWVKVQVTDNLSLVAKDSLYVSVSGCTPPELFC